MKTWLNHVWCGVKDFLANRQPAKKRRTTRLGLEVLEVRAVPAGGVPNFWTDLSANNDGLWSTAANWSLQHVPTASEVPTFRNDPANVHSLDPCTIPLASSGTVWGLDI